MENLGQAFIDGKIINLDTTSIEDLESYLQKVQNEKSALKDKLDDILEKIYN